MNTLVVRIVDVSKVPPKKYAPRPNRFAPLHEALKSGKAVQVMPRRGEELGSLRTRMVTSFKNKLAERYRTQVDHDNNCVWVIPLDASARNVSE